MREISRMSYNVSESDIIRARNQLKASLLFAQDNPSGEHCPYAALADQACLCSCVMSLVRVDGHSRYLCLLFLLLGGHISCSQCLPQLLLCIAPLPHSWI